MKKRLFATLLALVMALGLTATAWADDPVTGVEYVDADGTTKTCTDYTVVENSGSTVTWGADGQTTWYVVSGDVTIETVNPDSVGDSHYTAVKSDGKVRLILCDGAKLTVKLQKWDGGSAYSVSGILFYGQLTIYGQSAGTGQLEVEANGMYSVAIQSDGGSLTINGGSVTAKGGQAGIYNRDSNLTINDGTVTATGEYGIVNLGSRNPDRGKMTINGGTVTAIGTTNGILNSNSYGSTTINSGTVIASGTSGFNNIYGGSMTLPTADYWWRTAADGVYTASTVTPYDLSGVPYIEIITTQPVVTPPADEPEPEPEPAVPSHEPIRRQHITAVEDTTDTAGTTKADEVKTDTVTSAKTFDAGMAIYGAMAALSLTGSAWVARKKKEF